MSVGAQGTKSQCVCHSSFDELINLTFAEYESAHGQDGASPVTS